MSKNPDKYVIKSPTGFNITCFNHDPDYSSDHYWTDVSISHKYELLRARCACQYTRILHPAYIAYVVLEI
jgi:hypothetical protein